MAVETTSRSSSTFAKLGAVALTVGVAVGVSAMPYGYYMLLRFVFCMFSVYLLFGEKVVLADWER